MIQTNRVVQTGDVVKEPVNSVIQTDEILAEISRLYLERCKAINENNTIALQLFNHQIASLKSKLAQL